MTNILPPIRSFIFLIAIALLGSLSLPFTYTQVAAHIAWDLDPNLDIITNQIEHHPDGNHLFHITYIPLDERPINYSDPIKVARSSSVQLLTPPQHLLGGPYQPGDTDALQHWLMTVNHQGDGFIISADMLAYGGLVSSRTNKVTKTEAINNMTVLTKLKQTADKPVFVHDTIQRLAVTALNQRDLIPYQQMREWAMLYDLVHHLGKRQYQPRLQRLEQLIPSDKKREYMEIRERNHHVTVQLLDYVQKGYIDYLLLSNDDAAPYGFHRIEKRELKQKIAELGIQDQVDIYPGADENGLVLLSRLITMLYQIQPSFYVNYIGLKEEDWIATYEDLPFKQNVRKHIRACGAKLVQDPAKATIHLHIYVPDASTSPLNALQVGVYDLKKSIEQGKYVVLAEVNQEKKSPSLLKELKEKQLAHFLFSYSSWNTAGNTAGIALAHATMRYAFLHTNRNDVTPAHSFSALHHHIEFLMRRVIKDDVYKQRIIENMRKLLRQRKIDEWHLNEHTAFTLKKIRDELREPISNWNDYLKQHGFLHVYHDQRPQMVYTGEMELKNVSLPWHRLYDIDIDIRLLYELNVNREERRD